MPHKARRNFVSRTTRTARRLLRRLGFDVTPSRPKWPGDFRPEEIALCEEVQPYTMTSPEAIVTLASAVRHLTSREIPGAYVECGVWKGGSMMAVARTLLKLGRTDAHLYLFDTFEGMLHRRAMTSAEAAAPPRLCSMRIRTMTARCSGPAHHSKLSKPPWVPSATRGNTCTMSRGE
ncbi:MAG: TylF/MycF/NovP-related O-methyltransferase [Actinomycetota bacterium]